LSTTDDVRNIAVYRYRGISVIVYYRTAFLKPRISKT